MTEGRGEASEWHNLNYCLNVPEKRYLSIAAQFEVMQTQSDYMLSLNLKREHY